MGIDEADLRDAPCASGGAGGAAARSLSAEEATNGRVSGPGGAGGAGGAPQTLRSASTPASHQVSVTEKKRGRVFEYSGKLVLTHFCRI